MLTWKTPNLTGSFSDIDAATAWMAVGHLGGKKASSHTTCTAHCAADAGIDCSPGAGVSNEAGGLDGEGGSDGDAGLDAEEEARPMAVMQQRRAGRPAPGAARLPRLQAAIQPGRTEAGQPACPADNTPQTSWFLEDSFSPTIT